jgi:RNA polymerase sigma-70 factor (ECF subfamily)
MAPMPPTDPHAEYALLARLKEGDEAAFTALYRSHKDAVYRFALLYCGGAGTAADVVQDTFMHLIARPGQFDPSRGSVGAWLCGVARNMARRHMGEAREESRDPALLHDDAQIAPELIEHETPLERVLKSEAAEQLREAISRLAPHYRDVLILCELSDLSYAEAAQVCGVEIGTVRSRLSRARAALAQRLAPFQEGAKEAVS